MRWGQGWGHGWVKGRVRAELGFVLRVRAELRAPGYFVRVRVRVRGWGRVRAVLCCARLAGP